MKIKCPISFEGQCICTFGPPV